MTWFDQPIQVLIGSPCIIIYLATGHPPMSWSRYTITRTPLQSSLQHYYPLSKSCHSFYFPPNLAKFTFAYSHLLPSLLDRRWFSHSFQVYLVTHYELIQSFKASDLCALCFSEYCVHTRTSSHSPGLTREKVRTLVLLVLPIWSITSLFWTGIRAGLLA